jgi:hypothetical protein
MIYGVLFCNGLDQFIVICLDSFLKQTSFRLVGTRILSIQRNFMESLSSWSESFSKSANIRSNSF